MNTAAKIGGMILFIVTMLLSATGTLPDWAIGLGVLVGLGGYIVFGILAKLNRD